VVALQSDVDRPRRRGWVEFVIVLVLTIVVVFAFYLYGRSADDGVAVSATDTGAAAAQNTAPPANAVAADASATATAPHAHDAAAAGVDDRGFAALQNGEQHAHTFTQAISKQDRVELARQLTLARQVALKYPMVKDAEAAGLHRAGPFSPGLGAHYISFGNALGNADGTMSDADIGKPLAWIYDGTHPDSHIAGLFYMTSNAHPAGFAGPNDVWHVHHDICIKPAPGGVIDAPLGADHDATKAQCDAVGGNLLQQTQYLLHVWVVPGYESPEGVFSHLSSAITCDDGSYRTIADVTQVGAKTTMCADGTE
jgi:hypothetical protein